MGSESLNTLKGIIVGGGVNNFLELSKYRVPAVQKAFTILDIEHTHYNQNKPSVEAIVRNSSFQLKESTTGKIATYDFRNL